MLARTLTLVGLHHELCTSVLNDLAPTSVNNGGRSRLTEATIVSELPRGSRLFLDRHHQGARLSVPARYRGVRGAWRAGGRIAYLGRHSLPQRHLKPVAGSP
jgi:hypothetical protein